MVVGSVGVSGKLERKTCAAVDTSGRRGGDE